MAAVAAFEFGTRVPWGFVFIDYEKRAGHVIAPLHIVKNEELGLWSEISGVAHARGFEVGLGALGDGAGIAVVGFAVTGLEHIAGQHQGGLLEERVDEGRVGIRHQQHVGGFNALPTGDGGSVKGVAIGELVFVEGRQRHADVLLFATGIGETEVDELDFVVFHHLHHVCDGLGHQILLKVSVG